MNKTTTHSTMTSSMLNYKAVYSAICRTCLKIKKNMKSLNALELSDMWIYCAFIEKSDIDGLPSSICIQCFSQVKRSFSFKQLCEKSDITLKKYSHLGYLPSEVICQPVAYKLNDDGSSQGKETSKQQLILQTESNNENSDGITSQLEEEKSSDTILKCWTNSRPSAVEVIIEEVNSFCPADEKTVKVKHKYVRSTKKKKPEHVKSEYFCEPCFVGFTNAEDLSIHMCTHKGSQIIQCSVCKKTFEKLKTLKRHVKIHMTTKKHKCSFCPQQFTEAGSLKKHLNRHAGVKGTTYGCSLCKKKYADANYLKIHLRKHTGEKPYNCKICPKSFSDPRLLASHLKTHNQERIYTCNVCSRSFTHASTLNSHMRIHTGEKPYKCTYCEKSFIQSSNLSLHVRTHTGAKPYVCTVCNKGFGSSSNLAYHARIHTREKQFLCCICGKSFARSEDVRIHMRIHTGEKPFHCDFCPKRFTTSSHKKDHMLTHNGQHPPYLCGICGVCCTSRFKYRIHIKTHNQLQDKKIEEIGNILIPKQTIDSEQETVTVEEIDVI